MQKYERHKEIQKDLVEYTLVYMYKTKGNNTSPPTSLWLKYGSVLQCTSTPTCFKFTDLSTFFPLLVYIHYTNGSACIIHPVTMFVFNFQFIYLFLFRKGCVPKNGLEIEEGGSAWKNVFWIYSYCSDFMISITCLDRCMQKNFLK